MANENPKADLLVSEEMLNTYHTEGIKPISQKVAALQKTGCVNVAYNDAISQTIGGLTFTKNADGSVTVGAGTATETIIYTMRSYVNSGSLINEYNTLYGKTWKLVGCPSGGGPGKYLLQVTNVSNTADDDAIDYGNGAIFTYTHTNTALNSRLRIVIYSGQVIPAGGITFKQMITPDLSATYADYQPYSMTNRELTERKYAYDLIANTGSSASVTFSVDVTKYDFMYMAIGAGTACYGSAILPACMIPTAKDYLEAHINTSTGAIACRAKARFSTNTLESSDPTNYPVKLYGIRKA